MYDMKKINDRTWAFEADIHEGDTVRFFVLDGDDKCLVLDTGFMPVNVHGMVKELLEKEGLANTSSGEKKPVILANTHADGDHTGGNYSFGSFYMTREDYDMKDVKSLCPDAELIPVNDGDEIELGNRLVRFITIPGHTYGNTALLDVTGRILFPGDAVQTGAIFMFGPHRYTEKMAGSLKKLYDIKDSYDMVCPCHGQMILDPDAVEKVMEGWDQVMSGSIRPETRENMFGTEVDVYNCGFCRFLCDIKE